MNDPLPWSEQAIDAARPWVRWWWLGSALTSREITRELELFHAARFGGVEIQPIYAADPPATPSVEYLSPAWRDLLRHTIQEARRLGMDVDLTAGSGWPWGGPGLEPRHTARRLVIETRELAAQSLPPPEGTVAVTVFDAAAPSVPGRVLVPDTAGHYTVPTMKARDWRLLVAREEPTGQKVKRAGPGAQGPVVDHFSSDAVEAFLARFDPLLSELGGAVPRAAFTDSYEVYGADWTPGVLERFRSARGYDLAPWLHRLDPEPREPLTRRVIHDYRQTLRELHYEALEVWTRWCRKHGMRSRLQAHGSPGSLLDLYAASDTPETEAYGRAGVIERFARVAASAAHVTGKPVASAEAFTWLEDHFLAGPDRLRHEADRFFLAGINQLVAHGAPSSAEGLPFPGQLFYAGTDINEHMPWFGDLAGLNEYLARCQAALRWGSPDQEVLLYLPTHDMLYAPGGELERSTGNRLRLASAHNTESWLAAEVAPTAASADALEEGGFSYDFVSDHMIQTLETVEGKIRAAGGTYAALVLAGPCHADEATLTAVARLIERGAPVWIVGVPPPAVGQIVDPSGAVPEPTDALTDARQVADPSSLVASLRAGGLRHEQLPGFRWIRRADASRTLYFLKREAGAGDYRGEITLAGSVGGGHAMDPVTGAVHPVPGRAGQEGTRVPLEVEAGGVRIIVLERGHASASRPLPASTTDAARTVTIGGPWTLSWTNYDGRARTLALVAPADWTQVPELGLYSGVVTYDAAFDWPYHAGTPCNLDLGEMHVTARVAMNGVDLGTAWTRPYRLAVAPGLLAARNTVRIRVANLAANRIIEMDRAGIPWKKFYITGLGGTPFDARGWAPVPSGLLGPVTISTF